MSEKRVIGIRGLDEKVYDEIQKYAKETDQNIADVINKALEEYIQSHRNYKPPQVVSGHSKFVINSDALIHLNPLRVQNVERVIIENDAKLTPELIESNLDGIYYAERIYTPQRLYYIILKKAKNCEKIEIYENQYKEDKRLQFNATAKITKNLLDRFAQQNTRIRIRANGDLWIDYHVPIDLFDEVVTGIEFNWAIYCSEELKPISLTKATVSGDLGIIDENNVPIEVQQVSRTGRRSHIPPKTSVPPGSPFIDLSGISDAIKDLKDNLTGFGPQLQETIQDALKNMNIDVDVDEDVEKEDDRFRKKKIKVTPKHKVILRKDMKEPSESEDEVKIDIKDENDHTKENSDLAEDKKDDNH